MARCISDAGRAREGGADGGLAGAAGFVFRFCR
jgi:hypothetical protein